MPLYALEDLGDAYDATKALLWPFDRSTWVRLAVVVFLVGGPGAGFSGFQSRVPSGTDGGPAPGEVPMSDLTQEMILLVAAAAIAILAVGLVFLLVGSVMEFVFVESLRNETVTIRRYWSRRWRQGVRLFGFRLVLGIVGLGSVAVLGALFLFPPLAGAAPVAPILVGLLLAPAIFLLAILLSLASGFTTAFVVPIMLLEDGGVLAGWRRLWPSIRADWKQYLAYAVAGFVLSIAGGILVGILLAVGGLALAIPAVIVGLLGWGLSQVVAPVGWALIALVALMFVVAFLALAALVQVPVQTYLRYYALLVLGDVEADFDVVADLRERVRTEE